MARIRTVKPEFWSDATVGEASVSARLLFLGANNFADDHGGLDRSAKQLKAQVFPYDNIDTETLVQELLHLGLWIEYEAGGKKYLHIKGFRKHQKVEKQGRPRVPLYDPSAHGSRIVGEASPTSSGLFSGREKEGKGSKNSHTPRARETEPVNGNPIMPERPWERIRKTYPAFGGRQDWISAEHTATHLAEDLGVGWEELEAGTNRYANYCANGGVTSPKYVMTPAKFFGAADQPWRQAWEIPEAGTSVNGAGRRITAADYDRHGGGAEARIAKLPGDDPGEL